MNILTDILSLIKRKKYVDTVKPHDVLVVGIHEEPDMLGVASPIPYKSVRLIKMEDLVVTSQGCIHVNVPAADIGFAGIYKDTTTVGTDCYVNLRRLKSLSPNLTIVENGDFIDIDTTAEANSGLNVGGAAEVFKDMLGEVLRFRTLTSSDASVTITQNADTIDLVVAGGGSGNNIYNSNGVLTSSRSLDGFDGVTNHQLAFANLASFAIGATPTVYIATTTSISLTSPQIGIGGSTSVSIATPNTIALLGKVGQVLTLNNTTGGCDWEDKYFAVDLDSALPNVSVVNVGSSWTYTVTHNLDSLDIKPELFRLSDGATVGAAIKRISVNEVTVRVKSGSNPNGLYRIII